MRRNKSKTYILLLDSSWTLCYLHGSCAYTLGSCKEGLMNGSIILLLLLLFYCFLSDFRKVILGICALICLMHLRVLHTEPALNKEAAGPQFTSPKLGWPSCSCSQGWLLFRRWCCSADTQLFWSQFKSLSHSDVLHSAGLWLKACPEPPEMDRMLSTVLQWTPSKSRNSPHLTSLPWNRDSNLFLTQYPSCSTQ